MGLLDQINGTALGDEPALQANRTLKLDLARLPEFAAAIEAEFPRARVNEGAIGEIVNGQLKRRVNAQGDPAVPYAIIQGGRGHRGEPPGSCTVYASGAVNLTGVMTAFEWPPKPASETPEPTGQAARKRSKPAARPA